MSIQNFHTRSLTLTATKQKWKCPNFLFRIIANYFILRVLNSTYFKKMKLKAYILVIPTSLFLSRFWKVVSNVLILIYNPIPIGSQTIYSIQCKCSFSDKVNLCWTVILVVTLVTVLTVVTQVKVVIAVTVGKEHTKYFIYLQKIQNT